MKLSIYPSPTPDIILLETPSALELSIGRVRRSITSSYLDAHGQAQGVVSRWISIEERVESLSYISHLGYLPDTQLCSLFFSGRIKSLIAPDEPLTPGLLYTGVATLTGSILTRNSSRVLSRILLPPTLFLISINQFLPQTSHNISNYLGELEDKFVPGFSEKHDIAKAHTAMTWEMMKSGAQSGRASVDRGVAGFVEGVENWTGLKLKETLKVGGQVSEVKAKEVVKATATAKEVVESKIDEVKEVVEKKVDEAKRLV